MILHWPAGMPKAVRGSINSSYGHLIDVLPTVVDLVGGSYPTINNQGQTDSAIARQEPIACYRGQLPTVTATIIL